MEISHRKVSSCVLFLLSVFIIQHFTGFVAASTKKRAPLELGKGINGLDKVILHGPYGSSAEVYLYGAQVMSWKKNEGGEELIFISSKANFEPPKAIRGGIQICFPQYSNLGPLDSHGFARNRFWKIDGDSTLPPAHSSTTTRAASFVDLILKPSEEDLKLWPHRFEFRHRVALGPTGGLTVTSRVKNVDNTPFSFTFAYHPYFSVGNISNVLVRGLESLDYLDQQQNRTRFTANSQPISFASEFDRLYLSTPSRIKINDNEKKRTIEVRKAGLRDAVVWNPGDKKAKKVPDLGAEDYRYFVAVEPAAVEKAVYLNPGEEWAGAQKASAVHVNQ